ncbi:MAG TPA: hypothetical protein VND15_02620 [Candidatus Acidoferrales bacterium]|nr:hypothetical protein [Candidatus Acidoferrales bacterium]
MSIDETKCEICGADMDVENYYYISTGRLQQGPMSDPKATSETLLCMACFTQIKAELMVSIGRQKAKHADDKGGA